jgi:hypothetical protein
MYELIGLYEFIVRWYESIYVYHEFKDTMNSFTSEFVVDGHEFIHVYEFICTMNSLFHPMNS